MSPKPILLLLAGALLASCHRGASHRASGARPVIELTEIVLDAMPEERPSASFGGASPSLREAVDAIDAIRRDRHRKGLFLRIGPLGRGFARADELVAALGRLRAAHEPVHCHFEMADNAAYYVAARGCDRVSMTPAGHLALLGVGAHLYSIHGLLEWAGIHADVVQAGDAKGAADPFVRDEPSPEHVASVRALVDSLQARLAEAVSTRTGLDPAATAELFARGPFTSGGALRERLIDGVEFDDEARARARTAAGAARVRRIELGGSPETRSLTDLLAQLSASESDPAPDAPHVVLASLTGSIIDGDRNTEDSTAADPFVAAMRRFAGDPNVRAVVIRIDSPGGSALASDRMWHAVRRVVAARKPVVVSIGDMAASGGYYVASAADEILAHESSIVGSIGVVAGRPDLGPLMERFGVRIHPVLAAPSADVMMPFRALREDERARFEASAEEAYGRFLDRIRTGRPAAAAHLDEAAEGRIWSGVEARRLGLVDSHGDLEAALSRARRLAHLGANAPLQRWPRRVSLIEALLGTPPERTSSPLPTLADPSLARLFVAVVGATSGDGFPRAAMPYALDLR